MTPKTKHELRELIEVGVSSQEFSLSISFLSRLLDIYSTVYCCINSLPKQQVIVPRLTTCKLTLFLHISNFASFWNYSSLGGSSFLGAGGSTGFSPWDSMNLLMTSRVNSKSSSKVLAALIADDDMTLTVWAGAKAEAMAGRSKRVATEHFILTDMCTTETA
jgi:hypothetical protein